MDVYQRDREDKKNRIYIHLENPLPWLTGSEAAVSFLLVD